MGDRVGLYIHWPFCERICPYCDFTITRSRDEDIEKWICTYLADMRHFRKMVGPRELVSIYLGGGTPSLLPPGAIERLLDGAASHFGIQDGAEITLEANPTDAERSRFEDFRSAGINRLSLGLQSFDDEELRFLGRNHNGQDAMTAAEVTERIFPLYTFDFIYALPEESEGEWRRRLEHILSFGAPHLSFYQLTVETGTAFEKAVGRGAWHPAPDERAADLYAVTQEMTDKSGCPGYEVSNYAVPGREAQHNALYWEGAEWIGIGPGAHGRLWVEGSRFAVEGQPDIRNWLNHSFHQRYTMNALDEEAQVMELLAGGLRTTKGLTLDVLGKKTRQKLDASALELIESGHLSDLGDGLSIPAHHRLLTDYIVRRLVENL